MKDPQSIDEVIECLNEIIAHSRMSQSRAGYFAVLYKQMTLAVKQGMNNRSFRRSDQMEQLDVLFARRYIDSWKAYTSKRKCSSSWTFTFDCCKNNKLIVLQHILLGINTHINLDLAIAASQLCPGDKIMGLQQDFDKINDIIESLNDHVQERLALVWPPLKLLTRFSDNREDVILNFSIKKARQVSWNNALAMARLKKDALPLYINGMDNMVVKLGQCITQPGYMISWMLRPVLMMENKNVSAIIDLLDREEPAKRVPSRT